MARPITTAMGTEISTQAAKAIGTQSI